MKTTKSAIAIITLVLCMADFLYALDYKGFAITDDFGISLTSSSNAAPSPVYHVLGAEFFLDITDNTTFHPALAISWGEFLISEEKAAPAEIEAANAVLLFSILLRPYIGYTTAINKQLNFSALFSPTIAVKIPIRSYGQDPTSQLMSYYYGGFRLIYPELSLRLSWDITQNIGLMAGQTTRIALFHLWDGYPIYDELGIFLNLGIIIK